MAAVLQVAPEAWSEQHEQQSTDNQPAKGGHAYTPATPVPHTHVWLRVLSCTALLRQRNGGAAYSSSTYLGLIHALTSATLVFDTISNGI